MGWLPDTVRALSLSDFAAALDGFQAFHGIKESGGLSDEDVAELRAFAFGEED